MSKTLKQIQEFNRRKIICAVNGTENYQEALKIELGAGCKVKIKNNEFNEEIFVIDEYCFFFNETFFRKIGSYKHSEIIEIIGKPLTLERVLLGLSFNDISQLKPELKFYNGFIITINGYAWDLTKSTLEDQGEETQYGLLRGENE